MISYLLRRVAQSIMVLLGISLIVFLALHLTGDPAAAMLRGGTPTRADVAAMRGHLGLDQPLPVQYLTFLGQALRGDLGTSYYYQTSALQLVLGHLPATLVLTVSSMVVSLLIAFPLGILSATRRNSPVDFVARIFALLGVSFPNFWLGIMLILLFAVRLNWLPPSGYDGPQYLILPALTLGMILAGITTRLIRSSVLEALGEDYVRTARAKGLPPGRLLLRHVVRNALLPVVTYIGLQFGTLLGGAVIIEQVFSWPGVGQLALGAVNQGDFPLVMASVLVLATLLIFVNLLVDVSYAFLDPRIQYE
ncbi:MAG: transporter permease protein [Chloroflexi bacterium]|nr:transporter permease protein [Chloroflexota bacterium]